VSGCLCLDTTAVPIGNKLLVRLDVIIVFVEFTDATLTRCGFHCAQYKMPLKMDKPLAAVEVMSIMRLEPSVKDVSIL